MLHQGICEEGTTYYAEEHDESELERAEFDGPEPGEDDGEEDEQEDD